MRQESSLHTELVIIYSKPYASNYPTPEWTYDDCCTEMPIDKGYKMLTHVTSGSLGYYAHTTKKGVATPWIFGNSGADMQVSYRLMTRFFCHTSPISLFQPASSTYSAVDPPFNSGGSYLTQTSPLNKLLPSYFTLMRSSGSHRGTEFRQGSVKSTEQGPVTNTGHHPSNVKSSDHPPLPFHQDHTRVPLPSLFAYHLYAIWRTRHNAKPWQRRMSQLCTRRISLGEHSHSSIKPSASPAPTETPVLARLYVSQPDQAKRKTNACRPEAQPRRRSVARKATPHHPTPPPPPRRLATPQVSPTTQPTTFPSPKVRIVSRDPSLPQHKRLRTVSPSTRKQVGRSRSSVSTWTSTVPSVSPFHSFPHCSEDTISAQVRSWHQTSTTRRSRPSRQTPSYPFATSSQPNETGDASLPSSAAPQFSLSPLRKTICGYISSISTICWPSSASKVIGPKSWTTTQGSESPLRRARRSLSGISTVPHSSQSGRLLPRSVRSGNELLIQPTQQPTPLPIPPPINHKPHRAHATLGNLPTLPSAKLLRLLRLGLYGMATSSQVSTHRPVYRDFHRNEALTNSMLSPLTKRYSAAVRSSS